MLKKIAKWCMLPTVTAALVACGGGAGQPSPGNIARTLGGTVALGAPIQDAVVEVYTADGQFLTRAQTDAGGKYSLQIPDDAKGPFIIKAIYADESLYSIWTGQGDVANVSHLTDAVTAILSPSGAADGFLLDILKISDITIKKLTDAVAKIQAAVAPASLAIDDLPEGANFMNTAFDANGTGIDRLLDSASVQVTAKNSEGQNSTNIGVVFNAAQNLNQLDISKSFTFNSNQELSQIQGIANGFAISTNQLPPADMGRLYNDFVNRLNACYALPLNDRVSGDDIIGQACRDVFFESNPSIFKDGGFNARNRFTSLFSAKNPIRFTPTLTPVIAQDLQNSGSALIATKGEDSLGNYAYNRFYVKKFQINGRDVLGAIGDQNDYEFYVNSENEHRTFPLSAVDLDLVQSQFALILRLPNAARVNATAAIIEGPSGRFLMAPQTGRDNFRLCRQLSVNETVDTSVAVSCANKPPLLLYAARFVDLNVLRSSAVKVVTSPLDFDYINDDFFVVKRNGQVLSDNDIETIPNGAVWKATIYFSSASAVSPKVLYTHNTSRPMTSAELMGSDSPIIRAAKYTNLTMSEGTGNIPRSVDLTANAPLFPNIGIPNWGSNDQYNRGQNGYTPVYAPIDGGFKFDWSVNNGQIAPFILFMSGQVVNDWNNTPLNSRQPMEDSVRFPVSRRTATIFCNPTAWTVRPLDKSCDVDLDSNNQPVNYYKTSDEYVYNPGSWMTSTSLISRDQQQRSIIRGNSWFIPTSGAVAGGARNFVERQN